MTPPHKSALVKLECNWILKVITNLKIYGVNKFWQKGAYVPGVPLDLPRLIIETLMQKEKS